ncbi:MAG: 5'/3'-nucleotidase SurE [bacterium]
MSAAEAALLGIPAMAVSLTSHTVKDFGPAASCAVKLAREIERMGLEPGLILNVNVPPIPEDRIRGTVLAHQGKFRYVDDLAPHPELKNHYRYVLDSAVEPAEEHPDSDVARVQAGYISVTPLHLDWTAKHQFDRFADWSWGEKS